MRFLVVPRATSSRCPTRGARGCVRGHGRGRGKVRRLEGKKNERGNGREEEGDMKE